MTDWTKEPDEEKQAGNRLATYFQICYIDNRKGKVKDTRPTLNSDLPNYLGRQLLRIVGGYFFPLKIS